MVSTALLGAHVDINVLRRFVPVHPQELHAHRSRFDLLVGGEGRGSQIENHETRTETLQTCREERRG